ncbi:MAG: DUF948 domain-containing protein [Chloroflexaceae bacterium]|nr:DUF948 domain-containing protein [Chloroflexaceae bacterium]
MIDPLFWLGASLLLVAVSLTAVLVAALPALQELARAARSAEKLFDTLGREFPPTLEAIRLTGLEISELTDEINQGVKNASSVVEQLDQGLTGAKNQAKSVQRKTKGAIAGVKAAWETLNRPPRRERRVSATESNSLQSSQPAEANWSETAPEPALTYQEETDAV